MKTLYQAPIHVLIFALEIATLPNNVLNTP